MIAFAGPKKGTACIKGARRRNTHRTALQAPHMDSISALLASSRALAAAQAAYQRPRTRSVEVQVDDNSKRLMEHMQSQVAILSAQKINLLGKVRAAHGCRFGRPHATAAEGHHKAHALVAPCSSPPHPTPLPPRVYMCVACGGGLRRLWRRWRSRSRR